VLARQPDGYAPVSLSIRHRAPPRPEGSRRPAELTGTTGPQSAAPFQIPEECRYARRGAVLDSMDGCERVAGV
jgi:hypothetical protein